MKKILLNYFKRKKEEISSYGKKRILSRLLVIALTLIFASLVLIIGYKDGYYKNEVNIAYTEKIYDNLVKAKVKEIISSEDYIKDNMNTTHIIFKCEILEGDNLDTVQVVNQYINEYTKGYTNPPKVGKTIYIVEQKRSDGEISYLFNGDSISFDHWGGIIALAVILILLLLLVSKTQGLLTILSLALTILSVLFVFLPRILIGNNIYLLTIIICMFVIITTYLLVVGFNKKSLCASLGCFSGLALSGILTLITMNVLSVTGHFFQEDQMDVYVLFQTLYNAKVHISLKGLVFASTLIGALGAVMDVSLSLSSSLKEVYDNAKETSIIKTVKSGFVIGKDMIGTMVNTLILAYLACDLTFILNAMVNHSTGFILQSEYIAIAIAQALVGSIAMILTIPLTSLICAFIYNKNKTREGEEKNEEC